MVRASQGIDPGSLEGDDDGWTCPPVTPVLCFVDGRWPFFRPPDKFEGVLLESERSIVDVLTRIQTLTTADIDRLARILATALPPK